MFFSNVTITVHLHIVDVLDVTSGKVDFSMGEDGNSALKTGGPVPFDVTTKRDLCKLRLAMTCPIDLEHMPTHALLRGEGYGT